MRPQVMRFSIGSPISHSGSYLLVLMMVATGFATAIIAGLGEIAFGLLHYQQMPSSLPFTKLYLRDTGEKTPPASFCAQANSG